MNRPAATPLLASLLLASTAALAAAQQPGDWDDRIREAVAVHEEETVAFREHIHEFPELGNREFETARRVAEHLRALGFDEVREKVAHTGVVGVLRGGRPGPVVAVRADMDALPVTEDTDLPFASKVRTTYNDQEVGVMHACGHDVHTAVQYGVASVLAGLRSELPGTVLFIFQPAEEGPPPGERGGAELMLEEGAFADPRPQAIFGLHTLSGLPLGTIGYTSGPALAAVDHFQATITGVQTHGAQPQAGVDPVVMAAQAILGIQTIASRNVHPLKPVVVTVGMVHGGQRFNIIPDTVDIEGTVRTYDPEVRDLVEARMAEVLDGVTASGGGSYSLDYRRGMPATINDPELTDESLPSVTRVVGAESTEELDPTMGGEDFSFFANEVPGFFYRLGVHREGTRTGPHHSPFFRADNASVAIGMRVMSTILTDYLFRNAP